MRLEDWQKWLDTQYIVPEPPKLEPEPEPAPEAAAETAAVEAAPAVMVAEAPAATTIAAPTAPPAPQAAAAPVAPVPVAPAMPVVTPVAGSPLPDAYAPPDRRPPSPVTSFPVIPPSAGRPLPEFEDEGEVPSIERYLPFLRARHTEAAEPAQPVEPAAPTRAAEAPAAQEAPAAIRAEPAPAPVASAPEPPVEVAAPIAEQPAPEPVAAAPVAAPTPEPEPQPEPVAAAAPPAPTTVAATRPEPEPEPAPVATAAATAPGNGTGPHRYAVTYRRARHARNVRAAEAVPELEEGALWGLVPKHIQTLVALGTDEVAQNSYKRSFRESRIELISRLLDPTLSLEDTARLLNVCPTTVRRYTNRGLLTHQRTQGDQRRFKLSDVLAFLEAQSRA